MVGIAATLGCSADYLSPCGNVVNPAFNCIPNPGEAWRTSIDSQAYVARVGLNYLFHLGPVVAPVVARY